jgi:hypothetical protein
LKLDIQMMHCANYESPRGIEEMDKISSNKKRSCPSLELETYSQVKLPCPLQPFTPIANSTFLLPPSKELADWMQYRTLNFDIRTESSVR